MKPYTLALAANTPMPVHSGGEYFMLETAPLGGVRVEFFGASGVRRDQLIEDGEASTYAHIREGFSSLKLTSTLAQSVKFYLARDGMGRNVFSGSSDVTDRAARLLGVLTSWRGLNREGTPGFSGTRQVVGVAGVTSRVQLWNPAGSGVLLLVDAISLRGTSVQQFAAIGVHNAALGAAPTSGENRLLGGAVSAAELRGTTGGSVGTRIASIAAPVAGFCEQRYAEPVEIPEGMGIHIENDVVNTTMQGNFEWREVAP
jgi:hypothetical protein